VPALDKKYKHDIEVVVDRIAVKPGIESRLADSFEQALKLAEGWPISTWPTAWCRARERGQGQGHEGRGRAGQPHRLFRKIRLPGQRLHAGGGGAAAVFVQRAAGACPACDGLGEKLLFDPQLVVPNEALSIKEGAVVPWAKSNPPSPYYMQVLASLAKHFGFRWKRPGPICRARPRWWCCMARAKRLCRSPSSTARRPTPSPSLSKGVIGNLNRRMLQTESAWMKEELGKFQTAQPCEVCEGKRLKPEALCVKLGDADISSITRLPVGEAVGWFAGLEGKLGDQQKQIAKAILKEINERLGFSTMWGWITSIWIAPAARCRAAIAAHPAGLADWQRAFGRALCAG
jgi:excinuclease ABC subunit A